MKKLRFPLPFQPSFGLAALLLGAGLSLTLVGCKKDDDNATGAGSPGTVVYVESNLAGANRNSILAYRHAADGSLEALPGAPFATGGAGYANLTQKLGPNDTDEPIALSADKRRLFAVNQGSNTIAVFDIAAGGQLTPVAGSPFPSGGVNPASVGVAGTRLYVVNKNDDGAATGGRPNYAVFDVGPAGQLTPVAGATVETTVGASPSHALVAPGQRLLFVDDFLAFAAPTPAGTLRAFRIGADGKLTAAPNTPLPIAGMGGALGLWAHPTQNVLYVGFPMEGKVGVYSFDPTTGALTFRTSVAAGKAACWLRVNRAGTRLYALNSAESTISVYDLANPLAPATLQTFVLKNPGPLFDSMSPAGMVTSSEPFHEEFSPDEKTLFVVSQHANPDFAGNYNFAHALSIGPDGRLAEPGTPLQLPVDSRTRPQGVVSVTTN